MSDMPEYAEWLEGVVKRLLQDPESVMGIAVAVIGESRVVETGYWQCDVFDKILAAGVMQQDAMMQSIEANADEEAEI